MSQQILDLLQERDPAPKRIRHCDGEKEKHMTEAAVMIAFALHLFDASSNASLVRICPDGEHAKRFNIREWLEGNGFQMMETSGKTSYGGKYVRESKTIWVTPTSGIGDVVLEYEEQKIIAECKGGIVNTRHGGQKSKLRKGLCEAVGQLMGIPVGGRQIAVVPYTSVTLGLAQKMRARAWAAGIEIALVHFDGRGEYVN